PGKDAPRSRNLVEVIIAGDGQNSLEDPHVVRRPDHQSLFQSEATFIPVGRQSRPADLLSTLSQAIHEDSLVITDDILRGVNRSEDLGEIDLEELRVLG